MILNVLVDFKMLKQVYKETEEAGSTQLLI